MAGSNKSESAAGRVLCAVTAVVCILFAGAGCGASSGSDSTQTTSAVFTTAETKKIPKDVTVHIRPIAWKVVSASPPHSIEVLVEPGYCAGDPPPKVMGAQIRYEPGAALIKVRVAFLKKKRSKPSQICAGLVGHLTDEITLRRDLSDLRIYDSHTEPPKLRWPREG